MRRGKGGLGLNTPIVWRLLCLQESFIIVLEDCHGTPSRVFSGRVSGFRTATRPR